MAKTDTFDTIRDILKSGEIGDNNANLLLLSAITDLYDIVKTNRDEQEKINERVGVLWKAHAIRKKIDTFVYGTMFVSFWGLIWALVTDQLSIVVQG
jgi:hypothetical protein